MLLKQQPLACGHIRFRATKQLAPCITRGGRVSRTCPTLSLPAPKTHCLKRNVAVSVASANANGVAQAAPATSTTPEPEAQVAPLLLPGSWELHMDELVSMYKSMDERLDIMERQLLEMTRELRTGSASFTGGVTSMSSGGAVGVAASSGLRPPQGGGTTKQPGAAQPAARAGGAAAIVGPSGVDASGSTTDAVLDSGAFRHAHEGVDREAVMRTGMAAAAAAQKAQQEEQKEHETGPEKHNTPGHAAASAFKHAAHVAKAAVGSAASTISPFPPPNGWNTDDSQTQQSEQEALDNIPSPGTPAPMTTPSGTQLSPQQVQALVLREAELKEQAVHAAEERMRKRAAATSNAAAAAAGTEDGNGKAEQSTAVVTPTVMQSNSSSKGGSAGGSYVTQAAGAGGKLVVEGREGEKGEKKDGDSKSGPLLARQSLYDFNRLQSAMTEIANSGYIESVKQLRETLLIQEWDMTNRHLAKRRAVAMFERYVSERDLVHEVGGFAVVSALYEDPDALENLLPNDRMRMLARSIMEECLNEQRMALYQSCNQTAKEMAALTSSGVGSRMMQPLKQGVLGALMRLWAVLRSTLLPWTKFLPMF